ncbi:hypothetical protein [Mucilaginibacter kameinonensis]|uniref:hypothetical protein n=1 Tax=Mucilaginibacter kameinonensis TaxID=452286 RepID=UPI0013CF3ECB|nr:hypothetical protein [Mucilaginibacter kameinonensis]
MFHQISWAAYGAGVLLTAAIYYAVIGLIFYKTGFRNLFDRLRGRTRSNINLSAGDLPLPDHSIVGPTRTEDVDYVPQNELVFGPAESADEASSSPSPSGTATTDIDPPEDYSGMIAEVKTLVRVVNESGEPKENFELLFRLIVGKYPELAGSAAEQQVNDYMLNEGAAELPFPLNEQELKTLWLNEDKLQTT